MQYLLLIYDQESNRPMGDAASALFQEYGAFTRDIKEKKQWLGGEPLQSVKTATTVRVRDGKVAYTDGPFAETKEALAGFYLVEAKDLDEALSLAARIPSARTGSIEVRPIMQYQ